jgi:CBS domain-containing protein
MSTRSLRLAVPVETVMTRRVVQVIEETPMSEVRALAVQYDYNAFPVVTRDGRLVGMITKGDLLNVVQAALADPAVWQEPVSRWMAHGVLALRPADTLGTALEDMVGSGLRSLPVIDAAERVVGILSRHDLITAIGWGESP